MSHSKKLQEHSRVEVCAVCGAGDLKTVFSYDSPPPGETRFDMGTGRYWREYLRCQWCGHFMSNHAMDLSDLYKEEYMRATYGKQMREQFERIIALPAEESDNAGRVARINRLTKGKTVLDVGSGLCVFLYGMKEAGWHGTALDPDEAACRHAREVVGVEAVHADFMEVEGLGAYDLVTFNKVLEHTEKPKAMLVKARECVKEGGLVYVEVPDGELAARDREGKSRQEFFIEHEHVFGAPSLALLIRRSGFFLHLMGRLYEPSGKYTLWVFGRRESRAVDFAEADV